MPCGKAVPYEVAMKRPKPSWQDALELYDLAHEAESIDTTERFSDYSARPLPHGMFLYAVSGTEYMAKVYARLIECACARNCSVVGFTEFVKSYSKQVIDEKAPEALKTHKRGREVLTIPRSRMLHTARERRVYDVLRTWRAKIWKKHAHKDGHTTLITNVLTNRNLWVLSGYRFRSGDTRKPVSEYYSHRSEYVKEYADRLDEMLRKSLDASEVAERKSQRDERPEIYNASGGIEGRALVSNATES